jgi:hypothetical protein
MGLLLENEADCLSHQHKHRRHCPVIRCQRRERSPIPRERFSPIGHCRHWDGLGSTSAMSRIADGGGIEQPDGSFLHQRIHTPDRRRVKTRAESGLRKNRPFRSRQVGLAATREG